MIKSKSPTLDRRRLLALLPAGAALAAFPPDAEADDAVGSVSAISGEATAERAKKMRDLALKSGVFIGDAVTTADGARLGLRLAGKTNLRLGGGTRVVLDRFIADTGGTIELGSGALLFDGPDGGFPQGMKVDSPFALLAVRGTRFYAGKLGKGFSVFVEKGEVRVSAAGRTARLRPGEGTDIGLRGDPPGPVKKWKPPKIAKIKALVR
jgi:FecR protein